MRHFTEPVQPSSGKKIEVAKHKKEDSLSSFTSDDEAKPCKSYFDIIDFSAQSTAKKAKAEVRNQ